jgi:WD40 repeat protein
MRPVGEPLTPEGLVTGIGLSRDGRMVATGSFDGTVRLWDAGTGKPIGQPMTGSGYVRSIAFSRDGQRLAAGGTLDSTLRLWDTHTFQPVGDPMRTDSVVVVATFSPDGRMVATGSADGSIRLWNVGDQTQLGAPLTGHTAGVLSLDFSPDGTKLLSGSMDHTLRMWPVPKASPDGLCAKLTRNMSHQQWRDWVSPDIDYIKVCPGLPDAEDAG